MDLVFTDDQLDDMGILLDYSFDLAFGSGENNFELTVSTANNKCDQDSIIYIEGTEYGGIVDSVRVDTLSKQVTYIGRTYHGILDSKIIEPDSGDDYLTVSGDANTVIGNMITRMDLGGLFEAYSQPSGITISNYSFDRYTGCYTGIAKMLKKAQAKLHMEWHDKKVILSALPITDYSTDEELDSDHVNFVIERCYNTVNHLILLGKGDLKNRMVRHLYMDANGNFVNSSAYDGIYEYTQVFDYPNAESEEELIKYGKERLIELNNSDSLDMTLRNEYSFDVGDRICAEEITTGIKVTKYITKKIVTIKKEVFKINYKVGEI